MSYLNDIVDRQGDINEPGHHRRPYDRNLDNASIVEMIIGLPTLIAIYAGMAWTYGYNNAMEYFDTLYVFLAQCCCCMTYKDEEGEEARDIEQNTESWHQKQAQNLSSTAALAYHRTINFFR